MIFKNQNKAKDTSLDEIYICCCHSQEHQFHLWAEKGFDLISITISLTNYKNFFKRILVAIGYVFGYKSRNGNFDSISLTKEDAISLVNSINEHLSDLS